MNEERIKILIKSLEEQVNDSNKMFKEGDSHSFIIGYLQGTINITIEKLESILEEQKQLN
jgi:hypothetical protein